MKEGKYLAVITAADCLRVQSGAVMLFVTVETADRQEGNKWVDEPSASVEGAICLATKTGEPMEATVRLIAKALGWDGVSPLGPLAIGKRVQVRVKNQQYGDKSGPAVVAIYPVDHAVASETIPPDLSIKFQAIAREANKPW
jgi:hypothetical protein